ncbi:MAG: hypothetical protein JST35_12015 [Armatimonadetes bacterium]|nr:hypothetical protein [Armatimonadota bacterium]
MSLAYLAIAFVGQSAAPTDSYEYTVRPGPNGALHVRLAFRGSASGKTVLELPDGYGDAQEFYKGIQRLEVGEAKVESSPQTPAQRVLVHAPKAQLVVEYDLVQSAPGDPDAAARYQFTYQPTYLHSLGYAMWVHPKWTGTSKAQFTIRWEAFPTGWQIANSHGEGKAVQSFRCPPDELLHGIYVGGDFRIHRLPSNGGTIIVATRGQWGFSDPDFATRIRKTIEATRKFWNDYSAPYYLVSILPLKTDPNSSTLGGTGLTNSFSLMGTTNMDIDSMTNIVSHDYFHNWNTPKLGTLPEPQIEMYWFSEGFTDFFCRWIALKEGNLSLSAYMHGWNDFAKSYYLSPKKNLNGAQVEKDFWEDYETQRQPYLRGYLLASIWNDEIVRRTNGAQNLGSVMLRLRDRNANGQARLDVGAVDRLMKPLLGRSILPEIQSIIRDGKNIVLPQTFQLSVAKITRSPANRYDLGFDFAATKKDKKISGLDPNSNAYAAGLREGQVVVSRKPIWVGNPDKEVELMVEVGTEQKTIKFFPAKPTGEFYPQLQWNESDKQKILRRILGSKA